MGRCVSLHAAEICSFIGSCFQDVPLRHDSQHDDDRNVSFGSMTVNVLAN